MSGLKIVTFKLKQQIDIDELFPREFFEFERIMGNDIVIMGCHIRGVRDPSTRPSTRTAPPRPPRGPPLIDDGNRMIKIISCEYKLSQSEILDWLASFGEVLTEITEEPFGADDEQEPGLPLVGNGVYMVKMKLTKDIPNWIPMFGRKICIEYPGIKRQCSNCYGPHNTE